MSSYGLRSFSTNGSLLISSDVQYMHLITKLTGADVINTITYNGYSTSVRYIYEMPVNLASNLLPLVFIKPSSTDKLHAHLGTTTNTSNGCLQFDIICEGNNSLIPTLYIFTQVHNTTLSNTWDSTDSTYGIKLTTPNNDVSLDTRFNPLSLYPFNEEIIPPYYASDGGIYVPTIDPGYTSSETTIISKSEFDFHSSTTRKFFEYGNTISTNLVDMFNYSSIPQTSTIEPFHHSSCDCGFSIGYNITPDEHYTTVAKYGVYYRAGILLTDQGVECGWIPVREDVSLSATVTESSALINFFDGDSSTQTVTTDIPLENHTIGYTPTVPLLSISSFYT